MATQDDLFFAEELRLLSYQSKINILQKAKNICLEWRVDVLDCSKSFFREKLEIDFEEALNKFDKDEFNHFTIMKRKGYYRKDYIEICFTNIGGSISYFIWMDIDLEKLEIIEEIIKEELK